MKLEDPDEQVGVNILKRAMEEPIRQIANNAGFDGSVVVDTVKNETGSFGFNAEVGEYRDLIADGIIDPTKVTGIALQNAVSIAGLMITTEALITDIKEKEKAPSMPPGGEMY